MPAEELERAEILRGGSAEFGGAAPITVNLVMRRPVARAATSVKLAAGQLTLWPSLYYNEGDRDTRPQRLDGSQRHDSEDNRIRIVRLRSEAEWRAWGGKWTGRAAIMQGQRNADRLRQGGTAAWQEPAASGLDAQGPDRGAGPERNPARHPGGAGLRGARPAAVPAGAGPRRRARHRPGRACGRHRAAARRAARPPANAQARGRAGADRCGPAHPRPAFCGAVRPTAPARPSLPGRCPGTGRICAAAARPSAAPHAVRGPAGRIGRAPAVPLALRRRTGTPRAAPAPAAGTAAGAGDRHAPCWTAAAPGNLRPSSAAWSSSGARPQKSTCAASPMCARPCHPNSTRAWWRSPRRRPERPSVFHSNSAFPAFILPRTIHEPFA